MRPDVGYEYLTNKRLILVMLGCVSQVPLYHMLRLFLSLFLHSSSTSRWDIRLRHSVLKKKIERERGCEKNRETRVCLHNKIYGELRYIFAQYAMCNMR